MPSRILAIDYGEKRIGLAISDVLQMFAKPFRMISNTGFEDTVSALQGIISEQKVTEIVIGIPWGIEGQETPKTKEILAFTAKLQDNLKINITKWDERYTTAEANELLKEMGYTWQKSKKVLDSMAACLILKSYLETKNQ